MTTDLKPISRKKWRNMLAHAAGFPTSYGMHVQMLTDGTVRVRRYTQLINKSGEIVLRSRREVHLYPGESTYSYRCSY